MNKVDKIYIFFISIAILLWNPLSFHWMYSWCYLSNNKILLLLFGLISFLGVMAIWKIRNNTLSARSKNFVLSVAFTFMFFWALVLMDKTIGKVQSFKSKENYASITGSSNSNADYNTIEFRFSAHINSIGLRDHEIAATKTKYRILCIGDSWTFGWGVALENSWPKKLEQFLQKNEISAEVINGGVPGAYTSTYKVYLEKALPILHPDMVIVGVQQYEDLAQLFDFNYPMPPKLETRMDDWPWYEDAFYAITEFFKYSFKNTSTLFQKKKINSHEMQQEWKNEADKIISESSYLQRHRYAAYPDSIQKIFELSYNPVLLQYNINFPERKFIFNNPQNRATIFAANELLNDFKEMKAACDGYKAKLVFANLPYPDFTGHICYRLPELDVYNPDLEKNNHIDSIYRDVANTVNIPYIELTEKFKSLPEKTGYFFRYDYHPTEKGLAEIALYIADQLGPIVKN